MGSCLRTGRGFAAPHPSQICFNQTASVCADTLTGSPIENPIINSPFVEPRRHFLTSTDGDITGEIEVRRRPSEFFVPVARPKKRSGQLTMDAFGGPKRQQPNEIVNEIRQAVGRWRQQDYPHITSGTC